MQSTSAFQLWDLLLFWIFTGSGLLGLPAGDRDAMLMKAVPPESMVYFEWSSRGEGKPGADGIDGFAADPEVRLFFEKLDAALANRTREPGEHPANDALPKLVRLISAHAGCLFVGFEPVPETKAGLGRWIEILTGLHAGIILSSGDDTDTLWQTFGEILPIDPKLKSDDASKPRSIALPIPGYSLVIHRDGRRILFALGDATLERMVAGLTGRVPGLDSNVRLRQSLERISLARVSTIGWLDFRGIMTATVKAMGPLGTLVRPVLTVVGVDPLDHAVQITGVENAAIIERTIVATGGKTDGILALAAGQAIRSENLAHIPADADLVIATSVNLTRIYQEARKLLATTQPLSVRVFDEAIKQLETELELKIVADILPAFGDVITAFDSPSEGGLIASSLIVSLEVRDAGKAKKVFERLMKLIEQSVTHQLEPTEPVQSSLQQQPFLDHSIYFVQSSDSTGGFKLAIAPTFCLTERHLLFAVHPQAMKAHLRHLQQSHLAFDPFSKPKYAIPSGETLTLAYLNGPRATGLVSSLLPYLAQTLITQLEYEGVTLDSFSIPSAAAIIPYFGDFTMTVSRQRDGLLVESRNAPQVIVSLALLSAYQTYHSGNGDLLEDVRRKKANGAQLGAVEPAPNQVQPAVAEVKDAAAEKPKSISRKLAPLLLRALVPDGVQQLIPESAVRQLEEGPSPETIQRREEARQRREERRQRRKAGAAP